MRKNALLFLLVVWLFGCKNDGNSNHEAELNAVLPEVRYGIVVDSFLVEENTVSNGENLSIILNRYGASGALVHAIVQASKDVFDARSIRVGQKYTVISDEDEQPLRYWIYEKDLVSYFIFDFTDSLPRVQRFDRPIETHVRSLGGVINSSLFKTVIDAGATQVEFEGRLLAEKCLLNVIGPPGLHLGEHHQFTPRQLGQQGGRGGECCTRSRLHAAIQIPRQDAR